MGVHALPRTPRRWPRRAGVLVGSVLAGVVLVPALSPATAETSRSAVGGDPAARNVGPPPPTALLHSVRPGAPAPRRSHHPRRSSRPAPRPTASPTTSATPGPADEATRTAAGSVPSTSASAQSRTAAAGATGGGRPGPASTGVPTGTILRRHDGDLVITQPGAVYDRLDIHGYVVVKAPNVTIRRSIIRGGSPRNGPVGLLTNTTPGATNLLVEDTELVPEFPTLWTDAVKGWNFTLRRVDAHGSVDLVKVYGDHVRIESSWLHGTRFYSSAPGQPTGTHNDGVQVLAGHDIRIAGNTVEGASNAALMVTQDVGEVSDLVFAANWVDGGACSVNLNAKPRASMSGLQVDRNRFGRNTRIPDCSVLSSRTTTLEADGNVWDDSGLAVRVRRNG
jgi:hypothetical protein